MIAKRTLLKETILPPSAIWVKLLVHPSFALALAIIALGAVMGRRGQSKQGRGGGEGGGGTRGKG